MNQEYRKRIVDQLLKKKLESMGAVLIEGPKLCGKSTTAIQQAESILESHFHESAKPILAI